MKVGAHVSISGGIQNSVENALAIGANCMQIFGSSPRQWKVSFPDRKDVAEYKKLQEKHGVKPVFLHAPYLVNLASPKKTLQKKSFQALKDHFKIAEIIGADGLIFHLGSHTTGSVNQAIKNTAKYMKTILNQISGRTHLIMEVSSGGGNKLGDTLKELADIYKKVGSKRVRFCLDTAHAFTAGLLDYSAASIEKFVKDWDKLLGLSNLSVIHANDSKAEYNSSRDRHENLGEGKIGKTKLKRFARRKEFSSLPWILEVPGFDSQGSDKKNIQILKKML